jgi:hypothetical protein
MLVEPHGHSPWHPSSRPSGATSRPNAGAFIHGQSPWPSAAGVNPFQIIHPFPKGQGEYLFHFKEGLSPLATTRRDFHLTPKFISHSSENYKSFGFLVIELNLFCYQIVTAP